MYDTATRTIIEEPPTTTLNGIAASDVRAELDQILRSRVFIQSHRIRRFLQFIVEESLLGQPHRLKEYPIGLEVFDRREAFDPRVDSIVRVEARRLRNKLDEYYRTEGRDDHVRILLRKGSYMPVFEHRSFTGSGGPGPAPRRTVEIAPLSFINPAPNAGQLADEIQRRLAHVLIKEGCLQVIAQPHSAPFTSEVNGLSRHVTNADYVIEGSLEFRPSGFHLIVQLFNSADGSYTWSEATDFEYPDLRGVAQLAQSLLRELVSPPDHAVIARRHSEHKEIRDFYLQGRYHWKLATPDSIRNSVACFTHAVESDANYAAGWAALSQALLVSSMFGFLTPQEAGDRMKDAALKAISLNPLLPEAHVALGSVLALLDWNWAAGEQELEKSIQLDSHDATGHVAYGIHLACRELFESALAEVERALELDPASLFANFVLGWLYGVSRRYDEAISQHLLVSQLAPDYGLPYFGLGLAYAGKGLFDDAIAHFTNANPMKCRSLLRGQLGYCYARAGRRDEALQELGALNERSPHYVSPMSFAAIYAGLNDPQQALHHLERALEVHDTSLPVNLLNPEFDALRSEPRFQSIRQRLGLA
jgi:tetratricopeptide (TPR) repeat protein/TolB-like protein